STLSGNDQRGTGLVDKYRVYLIDDGIVQISLYQLFFIDYHIVTKVIESQLIIGYISDIAGILGSSLVILHRVQHHAYSKSQKLMNLSHPLSVTVCQVIVDGYNVYTLSFQCV